MSNFIVMLSSASYDAPSAARLKREPFAHPLDDLVGPLCRARTPLPVRQELKSVVIRAPDDVQLLIKRSRTTNHVFGFAKPGTRIARIVHDEQGDLYLRKIINRPRVAVVRTPR